MINECTTVPYVSLSDFDFADEQYKWLGIFSRLSNYKNMNQGWDGENAPAPSKEVIDSIIYYLKLLKSNSKFSAPDKALISPDGEVIIEWQSSQSIMELESSIPGYGEWMITPIEEGEPIFTQTKWESNDTIRSTYMSSSTSSYNTSKLMVA